MITDPRVNATQVRRWALWLFMFVGFFVHAGVCPPDAHAGVLGTTTRACVSPAAGAPPSDAPAPGRDRAGDAGRPCAPPAHPHRHAPCVDVVHRGFSAERSTWPCPAGAPPRCPLPAERPDDAGPRVRAWDHSSRAASPRSGAGLLVDLCSSRT
jgi:hypothetical protein